MQRHKQKISNLNIKIKLKIMAWQNVASAMKQCSGGSAELKA
jgi:hypothetical protein